MKLIVGLGNPGKKYDHTRHNTGFMAIDRYADYMNQSIDQKKFNGVYTKFKYKGEDIILLKPETYMNESGNSVRAAMQFFKIDVDDILVIYDDMDMPTGKIRLRLKGSAGGHNGIKSIIAHVGTQNFKRIRVGIDKDRNYNVVDYVLGHFNAQEESLLNEAFDKINLAIDTYLTEGFEKAMNKYN